MLPDLDVVILNEPSVPSSAILMLDNLVHIREDQLLKSHVLSQDYTSRFTIATGPV